MTTEDALLDAARAGDRAALERLLERHQAQVYRFSMKMCRDPEDAGDVVQESLLAMARGLRDFREDASLSTWLYTIARRACLKKRRRRKGAPSQERSLDSDVAAEVERIPSPTRGPEEALEGKRLELALDDAIAALEPKLREVLVLRDVEGLSAPEVAGVLGIGVAAVKSRLHRARLAVRAAVAPLLGGADEAVAPRATTCPEVLPMFSRHLEGDISAAVCEDMERHIASCAGCRAACDSLKQTLALCKTEGRSVEVPASVQRSVKVALRDLLSQER